MTELRDRRLRKIVDELTDDETTIMEQIERTPKVGDTGAFSKAELLKKKKCKTISNPDKVLASLQDKMLLQQVDPGKDLWMTTNDGQVIEHYLSKKRLLEDTGLSKIIRR